MTVLGFADPVNDPQKPSDAAMEIHEIRYFLAVCETLNFTRAAERCNVAQPSLTRAVKNLEDKLDAGPLIHRERGNTHLTELGHLMKPYFEQALAQMEQAQDRARQFVKLERSKLTVGLMCTIGPSRLIDLFSGFHTSNKGVDLNLRDGHAGKLEDLLIQGKLDVAIYSKPEPTDDRLHALPLYSERFVVALSPTHPMARKNAVLLKDLNGEKYLFRANCEFADHISEVASRQGVTFVTTYVSDRDDWIQSMALAGLGYTLIPEFAVSQPGLVIRPLCEPEFVRNVNLVTVRGRPHSPAVGAFVHAVRLYGWEEKLAAS